jgi:hypothetical protein
MFEYLSYNMYCKRWLRSILQALARVEALEVQMQTLAQTQVTHAPSSVVVSYLSFIIAGFAEGEILFIHAGVAAPQGGPSNTRANA